MTGTKKFLESDRNWGLVGIILDTLKENGLYTEFVVKDCDLDSFLEFWSRTTSNIGFENHRDSKTPDHASRIDILGSKLKTTLFGMLPGGQFLRSGTRIGAELNIVRDEGDIAVNLMVIPYMNLIDDREALFASQGIVERLTDNAYCRETFAKLERKIHKSEFTVEFGIPDEVKARVRESMFAYDPKANAYTLNQDVSCTHCGYEFGAFLWIDTQTQETTSTKCPNCAKSFDVTIDRSSEANE